MIAAALSGFLTSLSLILAIGAQNAFVLRQGLMRSHVFLVCAICAGSDAVLIAVGVGGFGVMADALPWLPSLLRWFGVAFLLFYGARSFWAAVQPGRLTPAGGDGQSALAVAATCLALTWLNPHVYLDTVVLLGAIASTYEGLSRVAFGVAAALASFVFFFLLGYGARALAPFFARRMAWRVLDLGVGVVMWAIAYALARGA